MRQHESSCTNAVTWELRNNLAVWALQHKCFSANAAAWVQSECFSVNAAAWMQWHVLHKFGSSYALAWMNSWMNSYQRTFIRCSAWMWQRERALGERARLMRFARMSFTINEALGIVLDEALVYGLVHSVACRGPCRGACSCPCWGVARFTFCMIVLRKCKG